MANFFQKLFSKTVEAQRAAAYTPPTKIFIESDGQGFTDYSTFQPAGFDNFYNLLDGYYSASNYIELFHCLPELFAPIHEIASRISDAVWLLKKEWNDEVDWNDKEFNKLFSTPNPLQGFKEFVYTAVCYEILTGKQFWYLNIPSTLVGKDYKNVTNWWNLVAPDVKIVMNRTDPYSATDISDFISSYKCTVNGTDRYFATKQVLPILRLTLKSGYSDLNCTNSLVKGADKALKNLIPVYEARGVIYMKRGALGFVVSRKSDESGMLSLTPKERKELDKDFTGTYGVTGGKETIAMTGMPVDFIRTAMSISELQPFDETLADASAIYAVLRVPPHLIPSKDKSTFNNADTDMKAFYENVIIPWAKKYAEIWTAGLKLKDSRKYIYPDFSHVGVLQENQKDKSTTDKVFGDVWQQRFLNGVCSLNEWIVAVDGSKGTGPIFEKRLSEMTPEEITQVKEFMNLKAVVAPNPADQQANNPAPNQAAN